MLFNKKDLFIFDLDGTLADSQGDIANSVNYVRSIYGKPPLPAPRVISYIGCGVKSLIELSMGDLPKPELDAAVTKFKDHYADHLLDNTKLYPGINELLKRLSEKTVVVLSNKPEKHCKLMISAFGLKDRFKYVFGGDSHEKKKPDALPILKILDMTGTDKQKAVMIGDGVNDILSAKNAGIESVAAAYGYCTEKDLSDLKPDFFVRSSKELVDLLIN